MPEFGNCDPGNVMNTGSAVKEQTLGPILDGPARVVAYAHPREGAAAHSA